MSDSGKHSRLLGYEINYGSKKFYDTGPISTDLLLLDICEFNLMIKTISSAAQYKGWLLALPLYLRLFEKVLKSLCLLKFEFFFVE